MDEFDVFMDAVNRRMAMENLFGNSLEHPDLQFIFLTPQVCSFCASASLLISIATATLYAMSYFVRCAVCCMWSPHILAKMSIAMMLDCMHTGQQHLSQRW